MLAPLDGSTFDCSDDSSGSSINAVVETNCSVLLASYSTGSMAFRR